MWSNLLQNIARLTGAVVENEPLPGYSDGQRQPLKINWEGKVWVAASEFATLATAARIGVGGVSTLTPVLDTGGAYADGDVLWTTGLAVLHSGQTAGMVLESITVVDYDDQGQPMDFYLAKHSATSLGTANSAPNISDVNAANLVAGPIALESSKYYDLGGVRIATIKPAMMVEAVVGSGCWLHAISRGTGTYTASGLKIVVCVSSSG